LYFKRKRVTAPSHINVDDKKHVEKGLKFAKLTGLELSTKTRKNMSGKYFDLNETQKYRTFQGNESLGTFYYYYFRFASVITF